MITISTLLRLIRMWRRRARSRRELARLSPRLRRDIGVTYDDAKIESDKPFWKE